MSELGKEQENIGTEDQSDVQSLQNRFDSFKQKSVPYLIGIALVLISSFMASEIAMNYADKQIQEALTEQREMLESSLKSEEGFDALLTHHKDRIEKTVQDTIEKMAKARRDELVARKYEAFSNADEDRTDKKAIYGNPKARFTLVEFSDLECPYCKRFHETAKTLVDTSNGMVNWQWKNLPLDFHNPVAFNQAVAAECVWEQKGNRGFWVFLDEVFKNSEGGGNGIKDISEVVESVGADIKEFVACMGSKRHEETVRADMEMAKSLGITGTPSSFIVDNTTGESIRIGGAQPLNALVSVVNQFLQKNQDAQDRDAQNQEQSESEAQ